MEPEPPGGEERGGEEPGEEGLIEFYSSFKEMFEFFCKNTTIHGTVRLVCSGRNRAKTAFWTLLLLASLAMLYWQFALMFSQFWAYPVVLTMSMDSEPKMFPAVTVCNLDPYRFEPISEQLEQLERMAEESLTFLYGPTASARLSHQRDRDKDEDKNRDKERNKDKDRDKEKDKDRDKGRDRDKAIPVQHQANLSTNFRLSQNFSLVRMWEPGAGRKHSRVGFQLCNSTGGDCFYSSHVSGTAALQEWFRFHFINLLAQLPPALARYPRRFQDLVYSCQYDGEPCRSSDYVPFHHPVFGSCYTFNSKGTDPFWRATKPGIPYGLSLILRAEQQEHIPLLSTVAGVKVMIHSHNQTPFLEHEGFHIRPGIATTIGIRQACLHSCFQLAMLRHCGCGYIYYPLPAGARYCDYHRQPAWGHCFYQLHWRLHSHRLDCFQHCPKPCRESLYKVSAGTAKWPSAKAQDWVHQALRHQNDYSFSSRRRTCCCPAWAASGASGLAPRCSRWWRCWSCSWTPWSCPCSSASRGSTLGGAPGPSQIPGRIPICGRSPGRCRSGIWDSPESERVGIPKFWGKSHRDVLEPQLNMAMLGIPKFWGKSHRDPHLRGLEFPNLGGKSQGSTAERGGIPKSWGTVTGMFCIHS